MNSPCNQLETVSQVRLQRDTTITNQKRLPRAKLQRHHQKKALKNQSRPRFATGRNHLICRQLQLIIVFLMRTWKCLGVSLRRLLQRNIISSSTFPDQKRIPSLVSCLQILRFRCALRSKELTLQCSATNCYSKRNRLRWKTQLWRKYLKMKMELDSRRPTRNSNSNQRTRLPVETSFRETSTTWTNWMKS